MSSEREERLERALKAILEEFKSTVDEVDRPKGGMQVPYHGRFASALRLPSVVSAMRWYIRYFLEALEP